VTDVFYVSLALFAVAMGLFAIASAIRAAGKWIGEALWHAEYQDPPAWWKR
jgi:hypothetical protein